MIVFLLALSSIAQANFAITPGKWRVETKVSTGGKEQVDPLAAMREALSKMPAAQRKLVEDAMAKANQDQAKANKHMPKVGFDQQGMTLCYTKEMLDTDMGLQKQYQDQKCEVSNLVKTSSQISLTFKCKNGSSGDVKWSLVDATHMTGQTKLVAADGKKSDIQMKAEFLSAQCD